MEKFNLSIYLSIYIYIYENCNKIAEYVKTVLNSKWLKKNIFIILIITMEIYRLNLVFCILLIIK